MDEDDLAIQPVMMGITTFFAFASAHCPLAHRLAPPSGMWGYLAWAWALVLTSIPGRGAGTPAFCARQ
jgi:hypothetical protein